MPGFRCKAHVGMKWFRSNIKHGSRLALLALAVQFVAVVRAFPRRSPRRRPRPSNRTFSYVNGVAAPDAVNAAAQPQQPASNHDSDQQPGDPCAICAVIALANAVLFATPPLLLLPQAVEFLYLTTDAEFVHLNSVRVAFQPRAPPALLTSID